MMAKRRMLKTGFVAALVLALLVLTGVRIKDLRTPPARAERPGLPVETAEVARGPISAVVHYTATVESAYETKVAPKITAPVESLAVAEGQRVEAGQLLAVLDETDLRQKIETLRQKVATARLQAAYQDRELERQKFLFENGAIAAQAYEQAQLMHDTAHSSLKEAEGLLREAEVNLGYARLYAPVDGFVSKIHRYPGDVAVPGQPVLTLLATDTLKVRARVIEADLAKVKVCTKVQVRLAGAEPKSFTSEVERVDPFLDPLSRTAVVDIAVPPEGIDRLGIVPGMSAQVSFVLAEKEDALYVPREAVLSDKGRRYVYIAEENRAVRREVRTGVENDTSVEIVSGLAKGQKVIVTGLREIYDGRPIYLFEEGGPRR